MPNSHIPSDLQNALDQHHDARTTFENLPLEDQREVIAWIESAKRIDTRGHRIIETIARMRQ